MRHRTPSSARSRLPDVRDGLTELERVILRAIAAAEAESPGRRVAASLVYGRVCEELSVSQGEFMAVLRRLGRA